MLHLCMKKKMKQPAASHTCQLRAQYLSSIWVHKSTVKECVVVLMYFFSSFCFLYIGNNEAHRSEAELRC